MRRRDVLAGLAGLLTVGAGAAVLARQPAGGVAPEELETVEAPGSPAGTVVVPQRGRVTFLEFFATWCHVCAETMDPLGEAYDAVGEDVQFVSATNEPVGHAVSREDVREWWADHDGRWPVVLDADLRLTEALDVTGVPTAVVLDADNVVTWTATGVKPADELLARIEAAGDADGAAGASGG